MRPIRLLIKFRFFRSIFASTKSTVLSTLGKSSFIAVMIFSRLAFGLEEYKAQNQLTREEVFQFLLHTARKEPNLMIHSFIQRVILFDDKIEIYYNFTNKQLPDGAPDECCRVSSNELKAFIYKDFKEKEKNYPKGSDSSRL